MEQIRENKRIYSFLAPRHLIWLGFNGGEFGGTCGGTTNEEIINACNILVGNLQGDLDLDTYREG
jgi:hypothetical protein